MKFLCDKHRALINQSHSQALGRWEEWMHEGSTSLEQGKLQKAISYFGCCYELSEMLTSHDPDRGLESAGEKFSAMDRLMLSGHLLAESLGRSGKIQLERHYLLAVHHHITHFMARRAQCPGRSVQKNLEISLLMLRRHCNQHGEFSGYQACLLQACQLAGQPTANVAIH
ncbi:MAG: hypothetical protein VR73_03470 [Gammaproteobacteria bacterium BRH_c0]|nr:MAG: hypothetical protein VR73_03470 [Gammaproteobacteria bacterium BRH_c0]